MARELKDIGEEYTRASDNSLASIVRLIGEIQKGFQTIASEMSEHSKRSVGQALAMQTQLAKKAYDTYVSELTKLCQMMFAGYGSFTARAEDQLPSTLRSENSDATRRTQRTTAHRATASRKTGSVRRGRSHKKPKR
jgi:hypothetical protein